MELPRVAVGVDVHPIQQGRACWIGGLLWEGVPGCAGHSDGDVVIHAACDALLSAAGLGDLGSNFGSDNPPWADAASVTLLAHSVRRINAEGWRIGNVAVQLIAETPHLGQRGREAEKLLSGVVEASISLTATTSDGLGLTGRGEGRAAIAVALVARG